MGFHIAHIHIGPFIYFKYLEGDEWAKREPKITKSYYLHAYAVFVISTQCLYSNRIFMYYVYLEIYLYVYNDDDFII